VPQVFAGSAAYPRTSVRPVLSIGNFDGLHLGHRHLIKNLVGRAGELGAPACVYTFDPPPRVVLAPAQHQPRIQSWPDKVRIMGELGVEHVIVERFTRSFAQHPPGWFVNEILSHRINPVAIVVGYDFRYGRARAGDVVSLRQALPDMRIDQVEALTIDGRIVSSSRIRELVASGDVHEASGLLGCSHRIRGTVVSGDRRGRTIGFPTANLETDSNLLPARGVYAVRARTDGGDWHDAVANLGTRPTFDGRGFLVEVHLLDFSGDLYGSEMEVSFVRRLRGEKQFKDSDALVAQIHDDVAAARESLS
jgi:riboflavin kinase/FMN adenylyltransferase